MREYEISNAVSGHSFGVFAAASEAEALNVLAREAGYADHADAMRGIEKTESDLIVTDVTGTVLVGRQRVDRDAVIALMDAEIREALHGRVWASEQAFVDAYCEAHEAAHGAPFIVN